MRKIWRYKSVQFIIFILIASSLSIITGNLKTFEIVLQNGNLTLEKDVIEYLIRDIKVVRMTAVILWGLVMGLYINFIYSINIKIIEKTNEEY
ncbi:hypothetical protein [Clostridium sp.]|uniref:hypothetical protein n=1 Tax=Clostridium sp. TaxID=1506 RepID=UPI001D7E2D7B|nr:hypothetical protein [Clostridium sp.]MBS5936752.1 hypothetical protein [Clostridium sp.]